MEGQEFVGPKLPEVWRLRNPHKICRADIARVGGGGVQ